MRKEYLEKIEKNENYGQKIYQQIKGLIISGKLKAGSTINEREYADVLGVSRTPLRDALALLEKEGWIEPKGKTRIVSPLVWKDILELIELREPLDMIGFRLAFNKLNKEDFVRLREILKQMEEAAMMSRKDYYTIMRLDTSFHEYINRKSDNSLLIRMTGDLNEKITRTSVLSMKYSQWHTHDYVEEHMRILKYMEAGDFEAACQVLSWHYTSWAQRMMALPKVLGFDPSEKDTPIQEAFVEFDK